MTETTSANAKGTAAPVRRGQLRIYLGAAAGGGKTFAMLGEAHRRPSRGADGAGAFLRSPAPHRPARQMIGPRGVSRGTNSYPGTFFSGDDAFRGLGTGHPLLPMH